MRRLCSKNQQVVLMQSYYLSLSIQYRIRLAVIHNEARLLHSALHTRSQLGCRFTSFSSKHGGGIGVVIVQGRHEQNRTFLFGTSLLIIKFWTTS